MDFSPLIAKYRREYEMIGQKMLHPSVFDNRQHYEILSREHQRLTSLFDNHEKLTHARQELANNKAILENETDPEMQDIIQEELFRLSSLIEALNTKILHFILPPNKHQSSNIIIEIRPAAGGDEASLFSADLFRMYSKFSEQQGWKSGILTFNETSLGGLKEAALSLQGNSVYYYLRFESGVHRVQRIPSTETSGRIHTSTVTVAVLPEPKDIDLSIHPDELRIETFKSSGPGGQSVNTTDSAIRITYIPSGLRVVAQQERSQHRNKELALRLLRARLLEAKKAEEQQRYAVQRKSQVGSGERSERIRTYNFPQNRITDHRFSLSWYNLSSTMEGNLLEILEAIIAANTTQVLEKELRENTAL